MCRNVLDNLCCTHAFFILVYMILSLNIFDQPSWDVPESDVENLEDNANSWMTQRLVLKVSIQTMKHNLNNQQMMVHSRRTICQIPSLVGTIPQSDMKNLLRQNVRIPKINIVINPPGLRAIVRCVNSPFDCWKLWDYCDYYWDFCEAHNHLPG